MTNTERTEDEHVISLRALLAKRLPSNRVDLANTLRELEMCYIGTIETRVKAQAILQNKRLQYLHPKDPQYTDMDRKIMLEGYTSAEQADYELRAGTEKALVQRIEVIRTLLVQ
jgi:hypothetical protein